MRYTGDDQDAILEYLTWQKTNHIQVPSYLVSLTYQCKIDGSAYTVISAPHCPFQFTLGEIDDQQSMTIKDVVGALSITENIFGQMIHKLTINFNH
jgi:hypothetical protein